MERANVQEHCVVLRGMVDVALRICIQHVYSPLKAHSRSSSEVWARNRHGVRRAILSLVKGQ